MSITHGAAPAEQNGPPDAAIGAQSERTLSGQRSYRIRPVIESRPQVDQEMAHGRLYEELRLDTGAGPLWSAVADHLIHYGIVTLRKWMVHGDIVTQLHQKGIPFEPTLRQRRQWRRNTDCRNEMAAMATAKAWVKLQRDVVAGTGWATSSKLSFSSYFIGGCLYAFADLARSERQLEMTFGLLPDHEVDPVHYVFAPGLPTGDHAEMVANRLLVLEYLDRLDGDDDRRIVWLKAQGLTEREIADQLGKSAKSIERRWARLRAEHDWVARIHRSGK